MMADHIAQRVDGTHTSQQDPQDSDDDVEGGQLWDPRQVEYLRLAGGFEGELSPQPSSSAECEHRVSPLDPNLSSAARYSPPPPYSSPMAGIEASLEHPDSPMEDLTHSSSLPIIPTGVSSSISSATESLVHSEPHRLPHSSASQASGSSTSNFVSPNSLFSTQPSLPRSQPRWASHDVISDEDDNDEDDARVTPALGESVWAKQKRLALRSIVDNDVSQPCSSGLQQVSAASPSVFMSNPQPGPSGVQAVLQSTSSCIQRRSQPGPSGLISVPQPSPSTLDALPSSNKIVTHHHESDSSESDDEGDRDSSEGLPRLCSTLSSGMRGRIVQLSDGEAEALGGHTSGGEASSSMRGHVTPLSSPSTPADNCIVSSSTGHIDSIPPTPAEFQGNDVSGPCSPVSPSLASVAILDSTVDSTSGREILNAEGQSSDDETDQDNLAPTGHIELPVMVDEAEEISTSEVDLQQSDDSQDVTLLVNPQGMFASERTSASRFIEQLSLSLSHFSGNSLDPSISGIVNESRIPTNTLTSPSDQGPYLNDPLATPGPSRAPPPCSSRTESRQSSTSTHQSRDQPSISSTHVLPDAVEVLDSSLPLLDITSGLTGCSTVSDSDHLSDGAGNQGLDGAAVRLDNEASDLAAAPDEIDPLVSLSDNVNDSVNSENLATNSENQDFSQLTQSYVLALSDENSAGSEDALSSDSQDKNNLVSSKKTKKGGSQSSATSQQSLLEPDAVTGENLNNSLRLSLTSSQPRKCLESDVALPGPSQQPALSQQLVPSQTNQVSLLVGGNDDSGDGALLMMVTPHPRAQQSTVTLEKPQEQEDPSDLPHLSTSSQSISSDKNENLSSSANWEKTDSQKLKKVTSSARNKDGEEFIGADFWCGECGQMYTHECPTHHLQDAERSSRTRVWAPISNHDGVSYKASNTDGCLDCDQIFNHECPQHIQAISDKPVRARAWASLPIQHLAIRKITGADEYGVFTRKVIPKRTRFGPLEGVMREEVGSILPSSGLVYSILSAEGTIYMDLSDEGSSNWMRFVRKATNYLEQNCVVMQIDGSLVFLTCTDILPRTELRVGYSKQYASVRNLHSLEPTEQEILVLESMRKSWPCYECDEGFESSVELQQHLVCHDEISGEEDRKKRKRLKTRRPRANGETEAVIKKLVKRIKVSEEENASAGSSHTGIRGVHANGENSVQHHQCMICTLAFSSPELLKIHLLSHQTMEIKEEEDGDISLKEEQKTCPQCSKVFENEVELSSHVEEHSFSVPVSSKPYKCDFCYKSFLRRDRLEAHTAVHGSEEEKPFRCDSCLRRFCSNTALNTHTKYHLEGSKGYDCPICREAFFSVASLKAHVSTHCVNEQYECPTCNKVFPSYSKIRRHIRSYHAISPHTCSICSKEMPSIDKLKIHMLSHSDRRDFLCPDCGKRFKRKDKMREHSKRMHSSERDARASKAPAKAPPKFVPKVDPTDYMQFEYKCKSCLLGFKRRGMLVNHLAKRHPNVDMNSVPELNRPIIKATRCYYCQYCEKMYRSSSKRKLHILKYHPGEELPPSSTTHRESRNGESSTFSQTIGAVTTYPHPCKWCYRQYASKARLLRHQRHQHPDVGADSPSIKDYSEDLPDPEVSDVDPLLDGAAGMAGEIPLAGQIVADGSLLRNHQVANVSRGEPSTSGVQGPEDDLLTQAMGEITPLGSGDQYVRLIGTGTEGQQVVVGTTQANRPLLMSSDGGRQGPTLALVTTDNADTVTLSLPAGQFISLIPGLSVSSPASVVTPDSRSVSSERESVNLPSHVVTQGESGASQELQGEVIPTIRMASALNKDESVEQVVLAAHQSPSSSSSVVWQQALTFTNTSS